MRTLDGLLNEYLDWRRSLKMSPETIEKNLYGIRQIVRWLKRTYGITQPGQIRREHLYNWQKHISSQKTSQGHPLKPRTINTHNESIKGFFKYLALHGHVSKSLLHDIHYVKNPRKLPGSVMSHEQVQDMLKNVSLNNEFGYRDRAMLELLYSAGIRAAELIGLDVEHVDLKNRTAVVTGKGDKERIVPIGKTAHKFLENYVVAIRPYLLNCHTEKALFLNKKGERIKYRYLLRRIHYYADLSEMENITTHTFRRSCTTELIRAEANMYHVKELLGHESLDTLRHYTKLTINDLKKTHEKCHPREKDCG